MALQDEVLGGAEWGATRAEQSLGGVCWSELGRIGSRECMVDGQLKGCGGDTPGVLGVAGLATMLVLFHLNSGLPEWVVATGGGVGDGMGKGRPVQWETSRAQLQRIFGPVEVVVLLPLVERSLPCTRLLKSC
jgi:hypothetical protein